MTEFERQMPEFHRQLLEIEVDAAALKTVWPRVASTTIDYGVMEGARDVAVIPAGGLGWNDVGSWESLLDVLTPDAAGNVALGAEVLGIETTGTLVHVSGTRKLVAAIGLADLVIVDTGDVLLVCPRERAQQVREIVAALKQREDGQDYL
jgi:mannose-1-phosphate guanylyltransferase